MLERVVSKMADLKREAFVLGKLNEQDRKAVVTRHGFCLMV
jgi:hypothetical protein